MDLLGTVIKIKHTIVLTYPVSSAVHGNVGRCNQDLPLQPRSPIVTERAQLAEEVDQRELSQLFEPCASWF